VLTHRGGKTSEVLDTEGRIVLADALAYAAEFRPTAIADVARVADVRNTGVGVRTLTQWLMRD
jgi:leucyl aminopeptidase